LQWVRRLQALGVDAVVLSPFEVPGTLGARLAVHLTNALEAASRDPEGATFAEIWKRAVAKLPDDPSVGPEKANGAHEFLLAGNGELRVCGSGR
jgi:hypothetical protein